MNILFITHQGRLTGSTYSIAFLAEGLAKKGHKVFLAGRVNSLLFSILKNSSVKLVPMRFKSKTDLQTIKKIRDVVNAENIHIINAQSTKDRYLTIFAKWLYNLPVKIVHTRRQKPESIGGWLQRWFYIKGTDKIIVVSDELKKMFIQKGFSPAHLQVIYNGTPASQYQNIKNERIEELKSQFAIQAGDVVIGCVARMKQQGQLIKALPLLNENIKVLFVGIPVGSLDDVIQRHQVKNKIIYAGHVSHNDA
ncbi:MAG: glycosyltransferase family 4 protein, partial [Chitinophagaceae bacterium]|nr:glycosyltransferase family 4 protein [Chitinophagaceae bacterium]